MDLLTVKESAEILRVSPLTVRRYIAARRLSVVRVGRRLRVPREAVERFIQPVEETALDPYGPSPLKGQPTFAGDPLWEIVGMGSFDGPTDIARNKHHYLAEAYEDKHR